MDQEIQRFLDEEGKIKQFPAKHALKYKVCAYMTSKFESGQEYTELEVNGIVAQWHTFGDLFLLRREMVECGLMRRMPDGSKYWRAEQEEDIQV